MQPFSFDATEPKREMDNEPTVRHRTQYSDSFDHSPWLHDANDASPFPDSAGDIEWMAPAIFSPDEYPSESDATSRGGVDIFTPRHSVQHDSYRSSNALQLDIPMGYQDFHPAPLSYGLYSDPVISNPHFGAHSSRQTLPQIITSDLPARSQGHARTPSSHSPAEHSMGSVPVYHPSHSAGTSTPSTAGHNSMPMTPAPLPTPSQPRLMIPGTMYSPGSPYMHQGLHHSPSPSAKSPFLSSPLMHSPSVSPIMTQQLMSHRPAQPIPNVLDIASRFQDAEFLIPQKIYRPNTQSDRRRYVEEVALEPPIMFYLQHPEGCGISCKEAMNSRFSRLVDRDDAMFINRGPSVSIRINWPGYPPWSRQIPTRDFRSPPMPITRSKLAKNVAKTVLRFLEDKKDKAMEEDVDAKYKVANITVDQVELVGLQHVSMGSWQAHLRLRSRT